MKKTVAIVGGGPAAMMCAIQLDPEQYDVTIYEKNKALGRKFLVAGKGGFNLTHGEDVEKLIERYTPHNFLEPALTHFSNSDLREGLAELGIPTFVGSSNRVYPEKGIKPIEVLRAFEVRLEEQDVKVDFNKSWSGWIGDMLIFEDGIKVHSDITIFALGGASWKVTGSDGGWLSRFEDKGIVSHPFHASNCALEVNWKEELLNKIEGLPLKNISASLAGKSQKGEAVITQFGLEGNAIYALSPEIRNALNKGSSVELSLDFKPMLSDEDILRKLNSSKSKKVSEILKEKLKLSKAQIEIIRSVTSREEFLNYEFLSKITKNIPIQIEGVAPIDEAISTVGGVDLQEVDSNYQLNKMRNTYCLGEMLNWDAPTGGYLLQGCFSMGNHLAKHLNLNA